MKLEKRMDVLERELKDMRIDAEISGEKKRRGAIQAGCAVFVIRNALLLPARFRHKTSR
jgi:hypothetical protein